MNSAMEGLPQKTRWKVMLYVYMKTAEITCVKSVLKVNRFFIIYSCLCKLNSFGTIYHNGEVQNFEIKTFSIHLHIEFGLISETVKDRAKQTKFDDHLNSEMTKFSFLKFEFDFFLKKLNLCLSAYLQCDSKISKNINLRSFQVLRPCVLNKVNICLFHSISHKRLPEHTPGVTQHRGCGVQV